MLQRYGDIATSIPTMDLPEISDLILSEDEEDKLQHLCKKKTDGPRFSEEAAPRWSKHHNTTGDGIALFDALVDRHRQWSHVFQEMQELWRFDYGSAFMKVKLWVKSRRWERSGSTMLMDFRLPAGCTKERVMFNDVVIASSSRREGEKENGPDS